MERYWYAVLRVVAGLLFIQFGLRKLFAGTFDFLSIGTVELIACALIFVGLFTRYAAGVMAAVSVFHYAGRLSTSIWPAVNGGTLDLLFFAVYVYIAIRGAGAFSLDDIIERRP